MVLSFYALSGHYGDLRAQIGSAATWSFLLRAPHGVRRTHADEHEHRDGSPGEQMNGRVSIPFPGGW